MSKKNAAIIITIFLLGVFFLFNFFKYRLKNQTEISKPDILINNRQGEYDDFNQKDDFDVFEKERFELLKTLDLEKVELTNDAPDQAEQKRIEMLNESGISEFEFNQALAEKKEQERIKLLEMLDEKKNN